MVRLARRARKVDPPCAVADYVRGPADRQLILARAEAANGNTKLREFWKTLTTQETVITKLRAQVHGAPARRGQPRVESSAPSLSHPCSRPCGRFARQNNDLRARLSELEADMAHAGLSGGRCDDGGCPSTAPGPVPLAADQPPSSAVIVSPDAKARAVAKSASTGQPPVVVTAEESLSSPKAKFMKRRASSTIVKGSRKTSMEVSGLLLGTTTATAAAAAAAEADAGGRGDAPQAVRTNGSPAVAGSVGACPRVTVVLVSSTRSRPLPTRPTVRPFPTVCVSCREASTR